MPITKRMGIIAGIQLCLISRMNFNNKENGGKKWKEKLFFLPNKSFSIVYPNEVNMIIVPNNRKNRDYYKYPSLSYFIDEL